MEDFNRTTFTLSSTIWILLKTYWILENISWNIFERKTLLFCQKLKGPQHGFIHISCRPLNMVSLRFIVRFHPWFIIIHSHGPKSYEDFSCMMLTQNIVGSKSYSKFPCMICCKFVCLGQFIQMLRMQNLMLVNLKSTLWWFITVYTVFIPISAWALR